MTRPRTSRSDAKILKELWAETERVLDIYEDELVEAMVGNYRKRNTLTIRIGDIARGVKTSSDYRFLRAPCEGWVDRLSRYHKAVKRRHDVDDWPFWYGERPLIGFLAAGFWGSGSACIEEYQADKKAERVAEGSQPRKKTYLGRGDFYFCHREEDGNIEFKLHDIGISQTSHYEASLSDKVDEGKSDAKKTHQTGIADYFGIFLRPYIGSSRDPKPYETNLKVLLQSIWETVEPAALAWWCPIDDVLDSDRKTKNVILGAILILKEV